MLVRFFKPTASAGALGGLKYLMSENRSVSPELLSGNLEITEQLLKASTFKNPYTTGCLSFAYEESDVSEELQRHLMDDFERTLLAGLEPDQYDIAWIRHTDKGGRLELNFHIVNTELRTGKSLQPYLHKFDMPRIDAWKSLQNDLNGFIDPNAPERKRTLQLGNNNLKRTEIQNAIHNYLEDAWVNNEINNRNDLINELKNAGIEITRITNKAISIKVPEFDKPIRLKGELYNDDLTACERFTEHQDKKQKQYNQEREQRIEANREKLDKLNQRITEHRHKKYKQNDSAKLEIENILDGAITGDFDTDLSVRLEHLESDNELLHEFISRVRESDQKPQRESNTLFDKETVKEQLKKVEKNEHGNSTENRDFTQRIRAITNAVRIAIQELKQAFRPNRESSGADDKLREIYGNKRAERIDILDNDARAAEQRVRELQSRKTEHPERGIEREKSERELKL
ncbi:relaxase/mobilization nuclease domain-containing protein [Vibrio parahaemolyticus]|nr:relaxase/mobilization nuclease domain-containing protein [Vibrio parahaemolyticus]EJC6841314.1 relaxase/mobilization nuclease domain-containing protein [Vibrio parahaemolyticus]EJC6869678.1 relaxase/mobilization nuclease domain-containing protein [Vibrio parahaemolyticus]EJG0024106.1 relaxase/mobilization nuclease domain-containing protein [Vibrio parahaemolyticus]